MNPTTLISYHSPLPGLTLGSCFLKNACVLNGSPCAVLTAPGISAPLPMPILQLNAEIESGLSMPYVPAEMLGYLSRSHGCNMGLCTIKLSLIILGEGFRL